MIKKNATGLFFLVLLAIMCVLSLSVTASVLIAKVADEALAEKLAVGVLAAFALLGIMIGHRAGRALRAIGHAPHTHMFAHKRSVESVNSSILSAHGCYVPTEIEADRDNDATDLAGC